MSDYQPLVTSRTENKDQLNHEEKIRTRNIAITIVAAWFVLTAVLAQAGVFEAGVFDS